MRNHNFENFLSITKIKINRTWATITEAIFHHQCNPLPLKRKIQFFQLCTTGLDNRENTYNL